MIDVMDMIKRILIRVHIRGGRVFGLVFVPLNFWEVTVVCGFASGHDGDRGRICCIWLEGNVVEGYKLNWPAPPNPSLVLMSRI